MYLAKSDGAINEVGKIYMSAIAKQMQEKFDAVIDSQILEMEGIVQRHPPEGNGIWTGND